MSTNSRPHFLQEKSYSTGQSLGARERQEDAGTICAFDEDRSLLTVVADGMGGHELGEVASRTAVDSFVKNYFSTPNSLQPKFRLISALQHANSSVEQITQNRPEIEFVGCTLVGAVISEVGLVWVSVGDSLLLRVTDGKVKRLNADHSMAPVIADALKKGRITDEQASSHPDKNALRSALYGMPIELIDVSDSAVPLSKGDAIILASDGLLTLTHQEIGAVVQQNINNGARAIVDGLLAKVKIKDKRRQDNTTIQVVLVDKDLGSRAKKIVNIGRLLFLSLVLSGVLAFAAVYFYQQPKIIRGFIDRLGFSLSLSSIFSSAKDTKQKGEISPINIEDLSGTDGVGQKEESNYSSSSVVSVENHSSSSVSLKDNKSLGQKNSMGETTAEKPDPKLNKHQENTHSDKENIGTEEDRNNAPAETTPSSAEKLKIEVIKTGSKSSEIKEHGISSEAKNMESSDAADGKASN